MVGAWGDVKIMTEHAPNQTEQVSMARVLLAMRSGDPNATSEALQTARNILGAPIAAAGISGYRRAYEAVLNLHLMHELEAIHNAITAFPSDSQPGSQGQKRQILTMLSRNLAARLDATLPTFRTREPILSMRRTAFALTLVY
jgi:serine/threonine-protein kinase ATR